MDIVDRLRKASKERTNGGRAWADYEDAADEIEKLRKAIEDVRAFVYNIYPGTHSSKEVERADPTSQLGSWREAMRILDQVSDEAPAPAPKTKTIRRPRVDPTTCQAASDGECFWDGCPQLRDGEPKSSGRHCPLDRTDP